MLHIFLVLRKRWLTITLLHSVDVVYIFWVLHRSISMMLSPNNPHRLELSHRLIMFLLEPPIIAALRTNEFLPTRSSHVLRTKNLHLPCLPSYWPCALVLLVGWWVLGDICGDVYLLDLCIWIIILKLLFLLSWW